jgi:hypothetical protein
MAVGSPSGAIARHWIATRRSRMINAEDDWLATRRRRPDLPATPSPAGTPRGPGEQFGVWCCTDVSVRTQHCR